MRGLRVFSYIFWEMLPSFLLGVFVFVFILLTFQALRLTEFIIIHGVDFWTVMQIAADLSVSLLPAIFPMSLLFAVLLTYGRLSSDSEIVAVKGLGLHLGYLIVPALFLACCVSLVSAQTSFTLAPWGNRQFEVLISRLAATKSGITLREGTFAEGFFQLVLYANKVDSNRGLLKKVFIYDERNPKMPMTIIAKEGQLSHDAQVGRLEASMRLLNGAIYRASEGRQTKIDFSSYEHNLVDASAYRDRQKSSQSLTLGEIRQYLAKGSRDGEALDDKARRLLEIELHKRWAISLACLPFALLGVGFGTVTNRRNIRGNNFVICVGLLVLYWILYILSENLARRGLLPPAISLWLANVLFSLTSLWSLVKAWR